MKIKVINRSKHQLPEYSTEAFAGIDLRANLARHEKAEWERVETLLDSARGTGGFGHTGKI